MEKIEGQLPEDLKDNLDRWNKQRDWNLKHGFIAAAVACAQNAEMYFDRWYELNKSRPISKAEMKKRLIEKYKDRPEFAEDLREVCEAL